MTDNPNKNDVVILHLDKPREVRFGHKALKRLTKLTGMSVEDLETNGVDMEQLEIFMFCGLYSDDHKNHGGKLELEHMEDLLDEARRPVDVFEAMQQALSNAFGGLVEGNGQGK